MTAATWSDRAADPLVVNVNEGATVDSVRMVLSGRGTVRGVVVDVSGEPVPYAPGRAVAEPQTAPHLPVAAMFQTALDGYFTVTLDRPGSGTLQLAVAAPGRPVGAFRVTPDAEAAITLRVPSRGGELRIVLPPDPAKGLPAYTLFALVNDEGGILMATDLLALGAGSITPDARGTTIRIPSLGSGRWRLARFADANAAVLFLAGLAELPVVRTVTVEGGSITTVDLREP